MQRQWTENGPVKSVEISLLGPICIRVGGGQQARSYPEGMCALLSYLALHPGMPCRREVLAGLLWPERPEPEALHNLRQALYFLRQALGDPGPESFLQATRTTIQFNLGEACQADVAAFQAAATAGADKAGVRQRHLSNPDVQRLAAAVELYRGDLLSGFSFPSAPFEEWLVTERERLRLQALEALRRLASYHEQRGEWAPALRYARRQLELEPWQEAAHRQVMRALAVLGQRDAALAQYEACRQALAQELSVEPEPETVVLYELIRDHRETGFLSMTPPHNLPAQVIPFIGREEELCELDSLLADPQVRLVSVLGPGGSGKTRLALEAAQACLPALSPVDLPGFPSSLFPHGVWFVSLAATQSTEAIVPAVAAAIGFPFHGQGTPRQQLIDYLRGKRMLLLPDNLEHLLEGMDLLAEILRAAPGVKVLATSRTRLNLQGEHCLHLEGMRYPALTPVPSPGGRGAYDDALQYSAVQLFLQSARRVDPKGFGAAYAPPPLAPAELGQAVRICRLVDGMPLGILLAASAVDALTLDEIAAGIERSLDVLTAEWRDAPERHRSMRAMLDSAWRMLTEGEQNLFARLSVFRGGFTRLAAAAVVGADARTLAGLVRKSFLTVTAITKVEPADRGGLGDRCGLHGRYHVHELMRQYAEEKLKSTPDRGVGARDQHSAYYCAALERLADELNGPRQQGATAEMDVESGNLCAAYAWASERGDLAQLDRAMDGYGKLIDRQGRWEEGERSLSVAVQRLTSPQPQAAPSPVRMRVLARALVWRAHLGYVWRGPLPEVRSALEEGLTLLDQLSADGHEVRRERAFALKVLGRLSQFTGDVGGFAWSLRESLALYRELDDRAGMAEVLDRLGNQAYDSSNVEQAKRLFQEALSLYRLMKDRSGISGMLWYMNVVCCRLGQVPEAERYLQETVRLAEEMGMRAPLDRANLCRWTGRFAEGAELMEKELLPQLEQRGDRALLALWLSWMPTWTMGMGAYAAARSAAERAIAVAQEVANSGSARIANHFLAGLDLLEGRYEQARQSYEEQVAYDRETGRRAVASWSLAELAAAEVWLGHLDRAWQRLCEALRLEAGPQGSFQRRMLVLPAAALYLAEKGAPERAVEIYALAASYPFVGRSRWYEDVFGKPMAAVDAALPPKVVAAAQERGRARDLQATVQELLDELENE